MIQLIKNLGKGVLRIGGNSSDTTYWTGKQRIAGTPKNNLTTTDIDKFSAFAKAVGWPVIFGLNLVDNSPAAAPDEAKYLNSILQGLLYAFQNGNEPDLYNLNQNRSANYSYTDYRAEWDSYYTSIKGKLPSAVFAGPDFGANINWFKSFALDQSNKVAFLDDHYYSTGPASNPSIIYQNILTPDNKPGYYLKALRSAAVISNLPYRVTECNSVYGGGKKGVSDIFASALWGLDFM